MSRHADDIAQSRDSIKERLKTGAWVFIWIVVAEAVSLGLAFWMRFQVGPSAL